MDLIITWMQAAILLATDTASQIAATIAYLAALAFIL
jgi:hypothetical protein